MLVVAADDIVIWCLVVDPVAVVEENTAPLFLLWPNGMAKSWPLDRAPIMVGCSCPSLATPPPAVPRASSSLPSISLS